MRIMVGFCVRASFQLQYILLPTSWVKKSGIVTCLKIREYNSSGPVRYTPKKSLNDQKSGTPPTPEVLNGISFDSGLVAKVRRTEVKQSGAVRRSNFSDGKFRNQSENCSTSETMQGLEDEFEDDALLRERKAIVEEKCYLAIKDLPGNKSNQDAEKLAIELLATRAFTAVELRKKLIGKRFSPDIAEAVVNDFKSRGLINDSLYAESFSRSRWSSSSWGPRRIKQALLSKGISGEVAQRAIKLVFEDGESGEGMSSLCLSKLSMDHLYVQASKQWLRGQDAPKETRKSRIVRWLQYRGFDWSVIRSILQKLETEYSS